jgi:hypothetical protein
MLPEGTQRNGNITAAPRCRSGRGGEQTAHVKGAPERVVVGWRARATPTLPCRNIVRSKVQGQGSLPGEGSLRAQMIA